MSAATSPPTPTVLHGRYELQRRLAQGGMAEVWLAIDRTLDRRVAVKWLKSNLAADEVVAERFRREAIAAASLSHPNIVAIHDVFEDEGRQAVVMQLVDGKSLRQLLDSQKRLSPELTCHIGTRVALALDHAHRAGFVHRDVKPGNIMLTADGSVLLTDFGIAKELHGTGRDLTSDNVMMGTAKYLSPEQVRGKRLDGRADLYSLGLVLYECLAGRVPFLGETDADTALARLQRDPTDLARLRATLPTGMIAIVHQLLERNPDRRPRNGAETAAALEKAAAEGPPHIDPTEAATSPVAPVGPGRLRRAASDHRGRAHDRRRAVRPRDDGDTPVTPAAGQPLTPSNGSPHAGFTGTAPDSLGTSTPPTGGPHAPAANSTPSTGRAQASAAATGADFSPPSGPAHFPEFAPPAPQRDDTPVAGPAIKRGTPARGLGQSTTSSKAVVLSLLAVGGLVVVMLWLSITYGGGDPSAPTTVLPSELDSSADPAANGTDQTSTDQAGTGQTGTGQTGTGQTGTSATPDGDTLTDAGAAADIRSVIALDPDGDSVENDAQADFAIDGDPGTAWSTVCYSSKFLGGKRGVGLVITFTAPTTAQLAVEVASGPYQLNFYGSVADSLPLTFEDWGEPLGSTQFDQEPGTVVSPTPPTPLRHMFVAFNEIASSGACSDDNPFRGSISEIRLAD